MLLFLLWSSTLVQPKIRKNLINLGVVFLILLFIYFIYFNCVRNHFIKEGFDINEFEPTREITDMYQFQLQKLATPVDNMPLNNFSQKVVINDKTELRFVPKTSNCPPKINGILIFKIKEFIYFVAIKGIRRGENQYVLERQLPSQFVIPDSFYYFGECSVEQFNPRTIYVYSIDKIETFTSSSSRVYPDYLVGELEPNEITILLHKSVKVNELPFNEKNGFSIFEIQKENTGYITSGWADKDNSKLANLSAGENVIIVFDIFNYGLFFSFNQVLESPTNINNTISFVNTIPQELINSNLKYKIYNGEKPLSYQSGNESIFFFENKKEVNFSNKKDESQIEKDDKSKKDSTPKLETHCYSCFSTDPKKIYYKIDQSGENAQPMGISLPDSSYNQECSEFPLSLFGTDAIKCNLGEQKQFITNPPSSEEVINRKFGINQVLDSENIKEPMKMNSTVMNKTQNSKRNTAIEGQDIDIDQLKKPTTLNINVAYYTRDGGNMDSNISDNDTDIKDNKIKDSMNVKDNNVDVSNTNDTITNNNTSSTVKSGNQTTTQKPSINDDTDPLKEHIKQVRNGGKVSNSSADKDCALNGTCQKVEKESQQKAQKSFNNHMNNQKKNWNTGNDFNNQFTNQSGVVLGGSSCGSEGANYFCRYSYLPINPAYYKPIADIMDNHNGVASATNGFSPFPTTKKWLENNKAEVNKYKDFYNNYYKNINELRMRGIEGD